MIFITYVDDLLSAFLSLGYMKMWFFPLIAIAFLSTVPRIIRSLTEWR